jgi:hypothetical protein
MYCHLVKFPNNDKSTFPYFATDTNNRLWLVTGKAERIGCFNALYVEGDSERRPFEYQGELNARYIKQVPKHARIQINIGSPTDA